MAGERKYTESWLQVEQELGARPVLHGTAEELRAQFAGLGQLLASQYPPPSDAVQSRDVSIGDIKARIYTPKATADRPLPVGVYAHGGGFVLGNLDGEDPFCRAVVENVNTILVSIDYRLAPENKAPAQLDDFLNGFQWAYNNASSFGGDPKKLYTMGTSAGGGLSLAVARKVVLGLTPLPKDAIKAVIAIVPVAFHHQSVPEKFRAEYLSYEQNAENVPMIDKKSMDQFFALNNLSPQDKDYFAGNDPEAFKLFPPTYVCTCEFDPLRDDGKVLTKALGEAAVAVKSDHYDGLPHCFWYFPKLPETSQFISKTVSGVKWAIEKM